MRFGAVGDDGKPVVDHWYGTTEPLSRVQADEELIFYDPVNFTELGGLRDPKNMFLKPIIFTSFDVAVHAW